ncbi:hypothetical protein FXV83_15625 [Bradyrhizobium hipponense]|uniref:Uncharacterized protein n=1 Tax=Bradyrhizobium hipponense TaxID=2605638 RepID=A0A5S4YP16_9BRAD|nr:hypothetical protein [Bradyrhizobium hipponense]TYO65652.1 hypothetical protein FXV83_15625 [Bradyrhizobium hipponense]
MLIPIVKQDKENMPSRECLELAKASAYSHDPDGATAVITGGTQRVGEAIGREFAEIGLLARSRQGSRLPRLRRIRLMTGAHFDFDQNICGAHHRYAPGRLRRT